MANVAGITGATGSPIIKLQTVCVARFFGVECTGPVVAILTIFSLFCSEAISSCGQEDTIAVRPCHSHAWNAIAYCPFP